MISDIILYNYLYKVKIIQFMVIILTVLVTS
jgi:hypothetical protein